MGQQQPSINSGVLLLGTRSNNAGNTLSGTPSGTTDTAVLAFTGTSNVLFSNVSVATTAAAGSIVSILAPGTWQAELTLAWTGAVAISAGIGVAMAAAPIVADPVVGTDGVLDATDVLGVASFTGSIKLSATFYVGATTTASNGTTVRFLATDSAGGAPVGLVAATASFRVIQLSSYAA